ncbi:MAG: OmpH family outer membrane protein [Gemmatimonadales bacterium]
MRTTIRAAIAALVLMPIAGLAFAQTGAIKVAYVNTEAIMAAAPGRAAADSLLNREGQGYAAQLKKMQDSINTLLTKYQKDEPTLSTAAKDKAQKAIQGLETDYQADNLKYQQQYQQRTGEVMAPIQEVVRKVLDDIRAEDGYALILDNTPGSSAILAADKNLDITDRVVARLRTMTASQLKSAPAATKPGAPTSPAGVTRPPKPPTQ